MPTIKKQQLSTSDEQYLKVMSTRNKLKKKKKTWRRDEFDSSVDPSPVHWNPNYTRTGIQWKSVATAVMMWGIQIWNSWFKSCWVWVWC